VWTAEALGDEREGADYVGSAPAGAGAYAGSWNASRAGYQTTTQLPTGPPGWTRPRPPGFPGRRPYRHNWSSPWWPPAGWPPQPVDRRPAPPQYGHGSTTNGSTTNGSATNGSATNGQAYRAPAASGTAQAGGEVNGTAGAAGAAGPAGGRAPLPRLADLGPLVQGLRDAGLDATMTVAGTPPQLPASVELAIYRVVQEALTNSLRYAGQGRVLVEITYTPEYIVVFVDDDGPGPGAGTKAKDAKEGGGHGLLGMQERIAAVGGTLTAGPRTPGPGWRVHARIPMVLFAR
jgi:hypothetical protein